MEFTEDDVAALYDAQYPWDEERFPADGYYIGLVMGAASVLDVGCGTGRMLHRARDLGHTGRFAGIDPDLASLNRARQHAGLEVEWVEGTAADIAAIPAWQGAFELATMVSHAFQCLIGDDELRASLAAVRGALADGGRFAFETRHPQARAWEQWAAAEPDRVVDARGRDLVVSWRIESIADGVVAMTETTSTPDGTALHVGRGSLRFLEPAALNDLLGASGFKVEEQYGDWKHGPITSESREIVTVARAESQALRI
ncbi:MAG TPA: class I SAM-dependent methyltransferase [Actinocrinis sp.]